MSVPLNPRESATERRNRRRAEERLRRGATAPAADGDDTEDVDLTQPAAAEAAGADGAAAAEADEDAKMPEGMVSQAVETMGSWLEEVKQDYRAAEALKNARSSTGDRAAAARISMLVRGKSVAGHAVNMIVYHWRGSGISGGDLYERIMILADQIYEGKGELYADMVDLMGGRDGRLAGFVESRGQPLKGMAPALRKQRMAGLMSCFGKARMLVQRSQAPAVADEAMRVGGVATAPFWMKDVGTYTRQARVVPNDYTLQKYGKSARVADNQQRRNRYIDGYTGRGVYESNRNSGETGYDGDGAYFGRKLGSMMAPVLSSIPRVGSWVADRAPDVMDSLENIGIKRARSELDRVQGSWRAPALGISEGLRRYMGDGSYWGPLQEMDVPRQYEGDPMMPDGTFNPDPNGPRLQTNMIVDPGSVFSRRPPSITTANDETGDLIVSHREYLEDIAPGNLEGFETVRMIQLNAGLAESFPLLAKFARYYSEYEFQQLIIRYRSLVTQGNASAAGSVIISTFYNPDAPVYTSKRQAENAEYTSSGKVTDTIVAGIECDGKKQVLGGGLLYVRRGALGSTNDLHTYDMGKVQIATAGATAGLTIGELWVEYTVRLSKLSNTNMIEPLQKGEGMTYSSMFPESTDLQYVSGQLFGVESEHSGTMPWPAGWTPSILSGKLSSPGVYRWNEYSINNNNYLPGKGGNLPYNQSLRSFVPMIAGFSASPNLLMDVTTHKGLFTFTTVPGAVYTFSYTMRIEPPVWNGSQDSGTFAVNNYNIATQIPPIFSSSVGAGSNLPQTAAGYPTDQSVVGTVVHTDYRTANFGGVRATVMSGPVRFPNGTVEETVSLVPVDGSSMTSRAFLVQAAMTVAVNGNTGGTAVLQIEDIGGMTTYAAEIMTVHYDASAVGTPPAVTLASSNVIGQWQCSSFSTSFKRVK